MNDPTKRWKLSPMDLESRKHWVDYSRAKDVMFQYTDTKKSPWYVVDADNKERARINCITHLLSRFKYEDIVTEPLPLPKKQKDDSYVRPPYTEQNFVPDVCDKLIERK